MKRKVAKRCGDCAVRPGVAHEDGCDVARCLRSGGQRVLCPAQGPRFHDCGRQVWTGTWPGERECAEWGWFSRWVPPGDDDEYGWWAPCGPDQPDAIPDLNRLYSEAHWDPGTGRWQLGSCAHDFTDHVVVAEGDDGGPSPDLLRECRTCGLLISGFLSALLGWPLTIRYGIGADAGQSEAGPEQTA